MAWSVAHSLGQSGRRIWRVLGKPDTAAVVVDGGVRVKL